MTKTAHAPKPSKGETRERLCRAAADYILAHGLSSASLRPLAQAAGTSDRMLIYHFGTKATLIREALILLSQDMQQSLATALGDGHSPARFDHIDDIEEEILTLLGNEMFRPYLSLWFNMLAETARGDKFHQQLAREILASYIEWVLPRLPHNSENPYATAWGLLSRIEGALILQVVGLKDPEKL